MGKKLHTDSNYMDTYNQYNDNLPEDEYQQGQIEFLNEWCDIQDNMEQYEPDVIILERRERDMKKIEWEIVYELKKINLETLGDNGIISFKEELEKLLEEVNEEFEKRFWWHLNKSLVLRKEVCLLY